MKLTLRKLFSIIVVWSALTAAQQPLTLQNCLEGIINNYPLIRQRALIESAKDYNVSNAWKGYYPQVAITAQASYQSDVTELPIKLPMITVESMDKDQYKAVIEASQVIYDGGIISSQTAIHKLQASAELSKNSADLRKAKEQGQQLFFGILLLDAQLQQVVLVKKDIGAGLEKLTGAVKNGVATETDRQILMAEMLKAEQRMQEISANRQAYNDMLCLLLGKEQTALQLQKPDNYAQLSSKIQRPELQQFQFLKETIEEQKSLITAKILPKVGLFGQFGYGKPGLNMLKNEFSSYYVAGARVFWNFSSFYTNANEKEILQINLKAIDLQQEIFLLNTNMQLRQQLRDTEKYQALLKTDDEILGLRNQIKKAAQVQLESGVITANDYIREVNQEDTAKQNKILHELQLLMAQYSILLTQGN